MKQFNTITCIVDTGLITSTVITEGISIVAFASGVGMPVGAALGGTTLLLSLAMVITQKSFKTFTIKQEKHNSVKLLVQSILDKEDLKKEEKKVTKTFYRKPQILPVPRVSISFKR